MSRNQWIHGDGYAFHVDDEERIREYRPGQPNWDRAMEAVNQPNARRTTATMMETAKDLGIWA